MAGEGNGGRGGAEAERYYCFRPLKGVRLVNTARRSFSLHVVGTPPTHGIGKGWSPLAVIQLCMLGEEGLTRARGATIAAVLAGWGGRAGGIR